MSFSSLENTHIQKLYPTVNNDDLLEFRIPPSVKGNMLLSDVLLRFQVTIPQMDESEVVPENLLGAKQFSSVEIRINGDAVSRRSCANEYFNAAYFQYMINFSSDYSATSCGTVGIFDGLQCDTTEWTTDAYAAQAYKLRKGLNDDFVYEIVMPIECSIFSSNQSLPTKTAIDLSFERAQSKHSVLLKTSTDTTDYTSFLQLEDPYLIISYVNDEDMQKLEQHAISRPIPLKFDEYVINRFNIPKDSPNIRLGNVLSGPLPPKLFWGITSLERYSGSFEKEGPRFLRNKLRKSTVYIDGNVLSGFPIVTSESAVSLPYNQLMKNTNRFMNCYSSRTISQADFKKYHFIYSADLEGFDSGSLTFDLDFEAATSEDLVLIVCSTFERTIELDNFRNFKVI